MTKHLNMDDVWINTKIYLSLDFQYLQMLNYLKNLVKNIT